VERSLTDEGSEQFLVIADVLEREFGVDGETDLIGCHAAQARGLAVAPYLFDWVQLRRVRGEPMHAHPPVSLATA
jgi:hypothetical protein